MRSYFVITLFLFVQQGALALASSYVGVYSGVASYGLQHHKKTALAKRKEIRASVLPHSNQVMKWFDINQTIKWREWNEFFEDLSKPETVGWGKNRLRAEEDFTPFLFHNPETGILESRFCMAFEDDGTEFGRLVLVDENHPYYGGFGDENFAGSVERSAQKLTNVSKDYRDFSATVLGAESGFQIEPVQDVRIVGIPSIADQIFSKRARITNTFFPNFQADLLLGSGPQKNGDEATKLGLMSFCLSKTLCPAIVNVLFENPKNIQNVWNKVLQDCVGDGEAPISTPSGGIIAPSDFLAKDRALNATFGMLVGVQKSFLAPHAHFGGYLGAEAFYERGCGVISIASADSSSRAFCADEKMFVYDEKMPAIHNAIHIKARNSLGVTGLCGVTTRNQWTLYVPVSAKLTFYNMEFCPDTKAINAYSHEAAPTLVGLSGGNAFHGTEVSMSSDQKRKSDGHKIEQARVNLELGAGVRLKASRRMTLGFRWMHSVGAQLNFDTPPYESSALHDLDRFGAHHSIHLGTHQFTIELLWNLH